MSTQIILNEASVTADKTGTAINSDGAKMTVQVQADSYGTDGKIILKGRANVGDADFITLPDPLASGGLAEYDANTIVVLDRLPQAWQLRADITISSGTMTNALVVVGA